MSTETKPTYAKLYPGHPAYERVSAMLAKGIEACDSLDHNESNGCSNPDCWKHNPFVTVHPETEVKTTPPKYFYPRYEQVAARTKRL